MVSVTTIRAVRHTILRSGLRPHSTLWYCDQALSRHDCEQYWTSQQSWHLESNQGQFKVLLFWIIKFYDLFRDVCKVLHNKRLRSSFHIKVKKIKLRLASLFCCSKLFHFSFIFHDFSQPTLKFSEFPRLKNDRIVRLFRFHNTLSRVLHYQTII